MSRYDLSQLTPDQIIDAFLALLAGGTGSGVSDDNIDNAYRHLQTMIKTDPTVGEALNTAVASRGLSKNFLAFVARYQNAQEVGLDLFKKTLGWDKALPLIHKKKGFFSIKKGFSSAYSDDDEKNPDEPLSIHKQKQAVPKAFPQLTQLLGQFGGASSSSPCATLFIDDLAFLLRQSFQAEDEKKRNALSNLFNTLSELEKKPESTSPQTVRDAIDHCLMNAAVDGNTRNRLRVLRAYVDSLAKKNPIVAEAAEKISTPTKLSKCASADEHNFIDAMNAELMAIGKMTENLQEGLAILEQVQLEAELKKISDKESASLKNLILLNKEQITANEEKHRKLENRINAYVSIINQMDSISSIEVDLNATLETEISEASKKETIQNRDALIDMREELQTNGEALETIDTSSEKQKPNRTTLDVQYRSNALKRINAGIELANKMILYSAIVCCYNPVLLKDNEEEFIQNILLECGHSEKTLTLRVKNIATCLKKYRATIVEPNLNLSSALDALIAATDIGVGIAIYENTKMPNGILASFTKQLTLKETFPCLIGAFGGDQRLEEKLETLLLNHALLEDQTSQNKAVKAMFREFSAIEASGSSDPSVHISQSIAQCILVLSKLPPNPVTTAIIKDLNFMQQDLAKKTTISTRAQTVLSQSRSIAKSFCSDFDSAVENAKLVLTQKYNALPLNEPDKILLPTLIEHLAKSSVQTEYTDRKASAFEQLTTIENGRLYIRTAQQDTSLIENFRQIKDMISRRMQKETLTPEENALSEKLKKLSEKETAALLDSPKGEHSPTRSRSPKRTKNSH